MDSDISRTIDLVQDSYSDLLSNLYSLSYYLEENFGELSKTIDNKIIDLKDFGSYLNEDIDDIKKVINDDQDEDPEDEFGHW